VIDRATALCRSDTVYAEDVLLDPPMPASAPRVRRASPLSEAPAVADGRHAGRLPRLDAEIERENIEEALERAGGNQGKAAAMLGVSRRTLINRLDEYGIARPRKHTPPI
jgi:DNA-binding NtrC family response regulator